MCSRFHVFCLLVAVALPACRAATTSPLLDHVEDLKDTLEEVGSTDARVDQEHRKMSLRAKAIEAVLKDKGRCDIERVDMQSLTPEEFRARFFNPQKPVLITGVPRQPRLRRQQGHNDAQSDAIENAENGLLKLLTRFDVEQMVEDFGDQQLDVLVSGTGVTNLPSDQPYNMSVANYVKYMRIVQDKGLKDGCYFLHKLFKAAEGTHETACANARHPVYIFNDFFPDLSPVVALREQEVLGSEGETAQEIEPVAPVMRQDSEGPHHAKLPGEDPFGYDRNWVPEFLTPFHISRRHFSLGPRLSGTYFHSHGPALNYVMEGVKRFFLFPADEYSKLSASRQGRSLFFSPSPRHPVDVALDMDKSLLSRTASTGKSRAETQALQPLVCDQPAGSYLFFPSRMGHATINLGKSTAGMAFEMDPPGLSAKKELVWKANTVSSGSQYSADYVTVGADGSLKTSGPPVDSLYDPAIDGALMEADANSEGRSSHSGSVPEDGVITDQDALDAHAARLSASIMESEPPPDLPQPPPIDEEYEKKFLSGSDDSASWVVHPDL